MNYTTLDGLKRQAKKYKKQHGVTHAQALDAVAKQGGYTDYQDALRKLGAYQ